MTYFMPGDYAARSNPAHFFDNVTRLVYQPHVYELALFVARRCGAKRIIDIGCGSGVKLRPFSGEFEILGIDCAATIPLFRDTVPGAKWIECDLDTEIPEIAAELLVDTVVICADVIEHLRNPDRLARYLAVISDIAPFVLISTPDRDRVRGWLDRGPPENPSHTMEWSASEFVRFLRSSGFSENVLYGHTINTDHHQANTTLLVTAGAHAHPRGVTQPKKVAAIIHCFNEVDILSEVVRHLVRQGVQVYLFDNWSTDGTWELARQLEREGALTSLNRYPERPVREYQWAILLKHTEEIASTIDADWVIHCDADELRYCPWPRATLVEGLSWVDSLGYNAIDFTVIDFRFLANGKDATAPYELSLNRFQFGRRNGHFSQIKAWKNRQKVNLVDSGGHEAIFEGRRIFPLKFLTKHYPLRSIGQAQKKVFCDRLPRIKREQTERGWHTQYNQYENDGCVSGWHPHELLPWAEHFFFTEYLVQRLSGIGVKEHTTEGFSLMSQQNQIEPSLSAEFRDLYRFDSGYGFWIPKNGPQEFTYSDGDEVERRIYETVRSAEDLSSVSVELSKKITDWPSKYHLSALRGNLLRPFSKRLKGRILEIGAGCGAITRFLGECGGEVVAIEGSQARASIAAARCRDLKNVNVIVDAVHRLPPSPTYDIVTLVGVLEYARKYFPGEENDRVINLIRHAKSFLKSEGVLILAIENQLGLKYFAGCDEDHVGVPMFGIEDRYTTAGVVTFGRRELQEMLSSAGFPEQSWWYPFPDYKLPTVLISEKGLSKFWGTKLHAVVGAAQEMDSQLPESPLFDLERAWRPVIRNGLGPDLANSFFVFAGMQQVSNDFDESAEAYHFAVERKPEYAKMVIFKLCDPPKMTVQQKLLYPELRSSDNVPIKMTLDQSEEFVEGQLWSQKLKSILSTDGWLFADLFEWARYWYLEFLREAELNQNTEELNSSTLVAGSLIDAIPRNLILRDNGEGVFIDKEWSSTSPVELGYVVFRGLFLSLIYVGSIASPEHGVPLERATVFKKIAKLLGLVVTDRDLERYAKLENDFQLWVKGIGVGDPKGVLSSRFEIRPTERKAHQYYYRDGSSFEEIKNKMSGQNVKVSIVIPVFNKLEYTKKCIESIINNTPKNGYEIIVIDNGSTDGTNAYLKSIQSVVRTIHNQQNLGFSKACNQGIRASTGPYVLFLNNDTEPQSGWLEPLVDVLDRDPSVAAVGSKLLFPDRTIQHAGVVIALNSHSGTICPFHIFYKERKDLPAANRMMEYAVCTAACLITRAERLRWLGGFDERFWNGYEDVDLCLRFCQNGWRVVYEPKSVLIHHESQSGPERFSKERQNTELLQKKWLNKAPIDIIIHPDGKISQKKETRIRCYTNTGFKETRSEDRSEGNQKCDKSTHIRGMVSIIMLTFNQLKYTQECVDSIKKYAPESHEIIFVDNSSSDGTVKWLRDIVAKNSNYKVIANKKNLGFSKGCNQGIQASLGEYIVLLNNDVVVTENWLDGMLGCLNHDPGVGIVGPMTNNISGPQKVPFVDYSSIDDLDRYSREFRIKNRHRKIQSRRVVGFCMLFKRQLVEEIGLLDEAFGSGNFEDDDFCLRSVLAGYQNMIAGDVFIHHYGSRTFIGNRIDYGSSLSGNRRIFIEKWSGEEVAQRFGAKLVVENAAAKAHELFDKGDIEKATACLLGALKQAPGERSLYYKLAEMLTDEKRFQDAVDILEALKLNGLDSRQTALLGYCEEALGHDEKARENSERALAIDPRAALATNVLGVLAFKKGEQDAAEKYFKKAIELDPGLGESYTNLGSLKWAAGKTEEALNLFERGFILSPTINDVAAAYHTAAVETKSFENAETVVREARALHPNHKRIAFLLIALLLQQEKHESAMQEIEKAMIQFGIDDGILSAGLEIRKRIGALAIDKSNRKRATLSLCMIVKNEEHHLARCLMSVKPIVDEMIVVDTGSDDRTKSIAAAMGAAVFDFAWANDFSEARNYSLAKASGDWILVLDADEVVSPTDYGLLRKITKKRPAKRVAYTMVTRNYTNNPGAGGWVANEGRYADEEVGKGWVSSTKVRLFVHDKRIQFVNPVHELVEPVLSKLGIQIKACDVPVHHYGRLDQDKLIAKGKEYYRLGLAKIDQTRGDYNSLKEFAIQASEIGEYDEAVKVWRKVIELQPNDAAAHMNMGYALLMMRKYDEATEYSKTAMKIDPELREAALNYAGAEMIAGDVHAAVSTLEHLLEKYADYPPAMGRLAAAYIVSGRKEDGLRFIQKLNSKGYDGASALEEQARAFMAESKFETAVLLLTAAVEKGVGNGSINDLLADCRSKIGGSSESDNPIDFSGSLQRLPSQLHGNSAAL